jgi:SAM-dependent methyltransferase
VNSKSSLFEWFVGHPAIYNLIQDLAGRRTIARRMQPWLNEVSGWVVDVGGGTGQIVHQLTGGVRYVCVDLDPIKLSGLKQHTTTAIGLRADASALPLRSDALDAALCVGVSHHLSADTMRAVFSEIARVLACQGEFIFLDALWAPRRLFGRLLWAWDRGSYPRTAAAIEADLRTWFDVEDVLTFAVLHQYTAFRCRKRVHPTGFDTQRGQSSF